MRGAVLDGRGRVRVIDTKRRKSDDPVRRNYPDLDRTDRIVPSLCVNIYTRPT